MLDIRESLIDEHKIAINNYLKETLLSIFESNNKEWILYLGYPLVWQWSELEKIDALLISKDLWIFIFSLLYNTSADSILFEEKRQKDLKRFLSQKLLNSNIFYNDESGGVNEPINLITYTLEINKKFLTPLEDTKYFWLKKIQKIPFATNKNELADYIISKESKLEDQKYEMALSLIQDLINLKPKSQRKITKNWSLGDRLNKSECEIANLDARQEKAIISFFDWIQRIRWLAWSGKTIVLALKIATYHILRPDAKIAVTFHSRSLKQQFKDKIEDFCISKNWRKPDWSKIDIIHAWWSKREWGIYFNLTQKFWLDYLNFWEARTLALQEGTTEFDAVCKKLWSELIIHENNGNVLIWMYDAIFIDEAQDLPETFLKLCYKILIPTKDSGKRRLIYAYDELQKLDEWAFLPDPEKIFWEDIIDREKQDLILDKCYRNSKEIITTAHSLWFWIYRNPEQISWWSKLVQFFDNPSLWRDIWYKTNDALEWWNQVSLYRDNDTSPVYFEQYYKSDDFVKFSKFNTLQEEWEYIANSIENDIKNEDLLCGDILVIYLSDWKSSNSLSWIITENLFKKWIKTYLAWADSPDIFYKDDSVTITGIHRAKWNEVWKVYIIWADYAYKGNINNSLELKKKRNSIFVAMTRSKGVVEICWIWNDFISLTKEFENVKEHWYKLEFQYPTPAEIEKMNTIYRSIEWVSSKNIEWEIKGAYDFINILGRISSWEMSISDYPQDIQELLNKILKSE